MSLVFSASAIFAIVKGHEGEIPFPWNKKVKKEITPTNDNQLL